MSLPAITSPAPPRRIRWLKRAGAATALVAVAGGGSMALPSTRTPMLQGVGAVLFVDEPVTTADVIVIAVDAEREGTVEAADLYHAGVAPRVAYFEPPLSASEREMVRRGLADPRYDKLRDLRMLGVAAAERIPEEVGGTREQADALRRWSAARGIDAIVLITQADHSRRVRRVVERALEGTGVRVDVRVSRYSDFDPEWWFQSEAGIRTAVEELLKLAIDVGTHPFE